MIVCHCKAKRDGEIRNLVREGSDTLNKVGRACGAGRGCGGCRPVISEIIRSEGQAQGATQHAPTPILDISPE